MKELTAPTPLYYQLRDKMAREIESRKWPDGHKLPSEMELCRMYHVSRITVRHTMELLAQEGYIVKKQGVGSFVKYPVINQNLSSFYSFNDGLRQFGYDPGSRVVAFETLVCPAKAAEHLQIEEDAQVVCLSRLRLKDGEPLAVETSYVPLQYLEGVTREAIEADGLYRSMERSCGLTPDSAVETFEAVIIGREERELLRTGVNAPGMHLERIAMAGGRIVEYCDTVICGEKYRFSVELKSGVEQNAE